MNIEFNKLKNYASMVFDTNNTYVISFLFGMLGSLFIFMIVHLMGNPSMKWGTVNVTGMVNLYVKQESQKNISPDILKKEVKQFGTILDQNLQQFSKENHVTLLLSEAVIAGIPDYTGII